MNCPSCEAPIKSSETICPYCGAAANTWGCPLRQILLRQLMR
ncbi:MAG: zinc-ribbon domain-containing protein [Synergistaceae bacterium]|nr:zinc-ribbon domain-containing protein [Synergistaceae bacterium]